MGFKWIGAAVGFFLGGGFIGGLVGYLIGYFIDIQRSQANSGQEGGGSYTSGAASTQQTQESQYDAFIYNLMYLSAHIIFADGRIYATETDYVRNMLNQSFGPHAAQRGMQFFEQMKQERRQMGIAAWNASVQRVCYDMNKRMPEANRIQIVSFLADLAKVDGKAESTEIKAIREIAYQMGLDTDIVDQMFALGKQTIEDAYKVMGIDPSATDDEVRKAYKKMVLQHHPDRVAHLGEEAKNAATKKMQQINKAKDTIYAARNMK